jgi:Mrp family chromosome partitioning ATPase/capsular polysaccharide biosynthesis protein
MTAYDDQAIPFEPTVLGSAWRNKWLVLVVVAAFGCLGLVASGLQSVDDRWRAEASVNVEDPRINTLYERVTTQPSRYVIEQMEVFYSTAVADRVRQLLEQNDPPIVMTTQQVRASTELQATQSSGVIYLFFRANGELEAVTGVNALIDAYADVVSSDVESSFQVRLDELNASIEETETELASIQQQIDALWATDAGRTQLEQQYDDTVDRLTALQGLTVGASADQLTLILQEIDVLRQELEAVQLALDVRDQPAGLDALVQEQSRLTNLQSNLTIERSQVEIDMELLGNGIANESRALNAAAPGGPSYARNVLLALLLGFPVGAGVAYVFALRRRTFTARIQPEVALGVPLLAEVPSFREERLSTELPVADARDSIAAEAFRFAAAAIDLRAEPAVFPSGKKRDRGFSAAFVTAGSGHGKTVVVANTALAAAEEGQRVLALDADYGDQALSKLLLSRGRASPVPVVIGKPGKEGDGEKTVAGMEIFTTPDHKGVLHLLGRDSLPGQLPSFFSSDEIPKILRSLEDFYDLVLVDMPPLLEVAYSSTLVSHLSSVALLIPYGARVSAIEEVWDRIQLTGTPVLGYMFNRAPLRRDLRGSAALLARSYAAEQQPHHPASPIEEVDHQ